MASVYIIAEAGVNHNGSLLIAKQLIDAAVKAKVDAIKFQTFITKDCISKEAPKAAYQVQTTPRDRSQFEMVKRLELTFDEQKELFLYCKKKHIQFLSSPFDIKSVHFLASLDISIFKIPSGEIVNLPYLRAIGKLNKCIYLSTGMSSLDEINSALNILESSGTNRKHITLLQCTSNYPTAYQDAHLKALRTLSQTFKLPVGLSDHTLGTHVSIAAVALGATVIEKHFTLDIAMPGPDHQASLMPNEFAVMVQQIRDIENAMGNSNKQLLDSEKDNALKVRKSIVASQYISKGDIFSDTNIGTKRPGTGLSPMQWDVVIGQQAKQNFQIDELIVI